MIEAKIINIKDAIELGLTRVGKQKRGAGGDIKIMSAEGKIGEDTAHSIWEHSKDGKEKTLIYTKKKEKKKLLGKKQKA